MCALVPHFIFFSRRNRISQHSTHIITLTHTLQGQRAEAVLLNGNVLSGIVNGIDVERGVMVLSYAQYEVSARAELSYITF